MTKYPVVKMSEITKLITDGKHGDCQDEANSGFFFLSSKDLYDGRLHYDRPREIRYNDFLETHRRTNLKPGDVLLANCGASIGRVGIAQQDDRICKTTFQKSISVIKADDRYVDNKFLYYFFKANSRYLVDLGGGTAQPNLLISDLRRIKLQLPPIETQRKIAAILSAYDDLIENNQRRIALLERLAEELYREWFVRMRFPGHAQVTFEKGVPVGWEVKPIGDLVTTQYGYTASADTEEGGPQFLRITDIVPAQIDWESVPYCKIDDKDEKKYLLREGDIVVARTGATVGYAKMIHRKHPKSVFASYLVRMKPKHPNDSILLGMAVESEAFKKFIGMFITGAAQPQANANLMSLFPIYYPSRQLIDRFTEIVRPLVDLKVELCLSTAVLKRTRDSLLPRLISGKLPVEALAIQFPPSMREEEGRTTVATSGSAA